MKSADFRPSLFLTASLTLLLALGSAPLAGSPVEPILALARKEKSAVLATLKEIVSVESGSTDTEGLEQLAGYLTERLKEAGGKVEVIVPGAEIYRMEDTPEKPGKMVKATFLGTGTGKILLLAHMDTVYLRGTLARQPFRVDGDRAYGLGIADDKQGVALVLHVLALLKSLDFHDYGLLTVLINGDEEISSPASRALLTKLGAEHDTVLSFEGTRVEADKLALATSGIASITLSVQGRGSHSGSAPEKGVNALDELAFQIMQTRNFSEPALGLKMNWTQAHGGVAHNVIPPAASASADVRVQRVADYDRIEQRVREQIKTKLLPESVIQLNFERRRPPLEPTDASRALAKYAQQIYSELGKELVVDEKAEGGGTDAAFAALKAKGPVIERFGLQGYGAHSSENEYVLISSIEPRLYLATRLIMDFSQHKTEK